MRIEKMLLTLMAVVFAMTVTCSYADTTSTTNAPTVNTINLQDLGEFQKSVEKFTDKAKLNVHHQHLLDNATNPNNSVIKRYTYALLLGINEPTLQTRKMAVEALDKLLQDPTLSQNDKVTISEIRNLIQYKVQEIEKSAH